MKLFLSMLMFLKKPLFLSSVFSFFIFIFSFSFASAQTPDQGLRLITSPLPINLVTEPGTTVTSELKVKNGGTAPETLKIDLMKFSAYEESGQPRLMDPEPQDDFIKWVTFSEPSFTLAPNEWKTVTATFRVPEEASFGYYYAIVFSRAQDESALAEKQTAIVGGTAVLVLLEARVPGATRAVEVAEFSTDKSFYEFLPTTFRVKLKNTGNVHIAPRGNIFIERGSNQDLAILEVNLEKGNILPVSSRIFETKWQDGFPIYQEKTADGKTVLDEQGNPVMELQWDWNDASKLRMGKYTAKLRLIYDNGQRDELIEGEVAFWVVPWRGLIAFVFVSIFFFIGFRNTAMNMWKKLFGKKKQSQ